MAFILNNKRVAGVGVPGKSAFETAKENGYGGTEEEFGQVISNAEDFITEEELNSVIETLPIPDVNSYINNHNVDENAHQDIREKIEEVITEERVEEIVDQKIEAMPKSESYTKEETLNTETKVLYGLDEEGTPNDVFRDIFPIVMETKRLVRVKVYDPWDNPLSGIIIKGLNEFYSNSLITNEEGMAIGLASSESTTLVVDSFSDLTSISKTINTPENTIVLATLKFSEENFINFLNLTSSKTLMFSPLVQTLDVTVVGSGCNGEAGTHTAYPRHSGQGGGGGFCVLEYDVVPTYTKEYSAIVGTNGVPGGTSSVLGISAAGGSFTNGNGPGGSRNGGNGSPGTVAGYITYDEMVVFGGGGGGGRDYPGATGTGAGYGGNGGGASASRTSPGKPGTAGYGGGGGGGGYTGSDDFSASGGGAGGSGRITIRIHHKTAEVTV